MFVYVEGNRRERNRIETQDLHHLFENKIRREVISKRPIQKNFF